MFFLLVPCHLFSARNQVIHSFFVFLYHTHLPSLSPSFPFTPETDPFSCFTSRPPHHTTTPQYQLGPQQRRRLLRKQMRTVSQHPEAVRLEDSAVEAINAMINDAKLRGPTEDHLKAIKEKLGVVGAVFVKCPMGCGTEPKGKTDLLYHINAVHLKCELPCPHCDLVQYTPKKLRTHIKSK